MFPLRKLSELSPRTRLRKISRILHAEELTMLRGEAPDPAYLSALAGLCATAAAGGSSAAIAASAEALSHAAAKGANPVEISRRISVLRNDILASLGAEPSEWDLLEKDTGALDRSAVSIRPIAAYLEDVRSPFNVGSMFRTAEAFGAERILLSPRTPLPTHPRARKTARGADAALPWKVCELSALEGEPGIFALELGGVPIREFRFPPKGMVLVGSEELGLSPEALALADRGLGRVSIPLSGAKRSLNVSVAFGILMSRWHESLRQG